MPLWALLGLGGVAAYLLLSKSASAQEGAGYQGTILGPGGSSTPLGSAASTSNEDSATTLGPGGSSTPLGSVASMSGAGTVADWSSNAVDLANAAEGVTSNVTLAPGTLQGVTPVQPIPVITSGWSGGARWDPMSRRYY